MRRKRTRLTPAFSDSRVRCGAWIGVSAAVLSATIAAARDARSHFVPLVPASYAGNEREPPDERHSPGKAHRDPPAPQISATQRGDTLDVTVKSGVGPPNLQNLPACAFKPSREQRGVWRCRLIVRDLRAAVIDLVVTSGPSVVGYLQFRGTRSGLPDPSRPLTAGTVAHGTFDSRELGQPRGYDVYEPTRPGERPLPIVYVLDRGSYSQGLMAAIDLLIQQRALPPLVVVALDAGVRDLTGRDNLRAREMIAGLDADAHSAFEQFFFEEFLPSTQRMYNASDDPRLVTIIGASASASWVLDEANSQSFKARNWGAFSVPSENPVLKLPAKQAGRIAMGAGRLDAAYFATTARICKAINAQRGQCAFFAVQGGHSQGVWDLLTTRLLTEEFDRPYRSPTLLPLPTER